MERIVRANCDNFDTIRVRQLKLSVKVVHRANSLATLEVAFKPTSMKRIEDLNLLYLCGGRTLLQCVDRCFA